MERQAEIDITFLEEYPHIVRDTEYITFLYMNTLRWHTGSFNCIFKI